MKNPILKLAVATAIALSFACGGSSSDDSVKVTGVTVAPTSVSVEVGKTTTITATVAPANATNRKVEWKSNKTEIATVSDTGVVSGKAAGDANITAKTLDGGFEATAVVTVTVPAVISVTGVTVAPKVADVVLGGKTTIVATVAPADATNKVVRWSSSDETKATVNENGVVAGVSLGGPVVITATTDDGGFTDTATVTVIQGGGGDLKGVYVGGSYGMTKDGVIDPTYNGYYITAMIVHNGELHVVGWDETDAVYWKEGTKQILSKTPGSWAEALGVRIINNKVYVVGRESKGATWTSRYWVDGVGTSINATGWTENLMSDIAVSGEKVFAVGQARGASSGNRGPMVMNMVSGNGVSWGSTGGSEGPLARKCVLIDGGARVEMACEGFSVFSCDANDDFSNASIERLGWLTDIQVINGIRYLCGVETDSGAYLSIYIAGFDMVEMDPELDYSEAYGMAVDAAGNVYVCGLTYNDAETIFRPTMWKNGIVVPVAAFAGMNDAIAEVVCVKE